MKLLCANSIKALLGIAVLMHFSPGNVLAQCSQRVEVSNIVTDEQETRLAFKVDVVAQAQQIYNGQLVKIDGTDQVLIRSFSGSGDDSFDFTDLVVNNESFYRVIIEYEGEEQFLCKRRVKDIVITDTK